MATFFWKIASLFLFFLILSFSNDNNVDAAVYPKLQGWYRSRMTYYYDFGSRSPSDNTKVSSAPLYEIITGFDANSNPIPVAGQYRIASMVPPETGASDLWNIVYLVVNNTANDTYVANTVTDADIAKAQFEQSLVKGPVINCPIAPAGSTLEGGEVDLTQVWYQNTSMWCFDFGSSTSGMAPMYTFPTVKDQAAIVDAIPNDSGYSPFHSIYEITPPSNYIPNDFKSFEEVEKYRLVPSNSGVVANRPIVKTDDTVIDDTKDYTSASSIVQIFSYSFLLAILSSSCFYLTMI